MSVSRDVAGLAQNCDILSRQPRRWSPTDKHVTHQLNEMKVEKNNLVSDWLVYLAARKVVVAGTVEMIGLVAVSVSGDVITDVQAD